VPLPPPQQMALRPFGVISTKLLQNAFSSSRGCCTIHPGRAMLHGSCYVTVSVMVSALSFSRPCFHAWCVYSMMFRTGMLERPPQNAG